MRVGHGYDVHKYCENRKLILGGVQIDFAKGLQGHSDADVLVHAVMDALLGAAALGDIGNLFPDTDQKYKDVSSLKLLKTVCDLIRKKGYKIQNIDSTIVAQAPKLSGYISDMKINVANVCSLSTDQVNIKATTEEGLGFTGTMQGICAHAVCIIE